MHESETTAFILRGREGYRPPSRGGGFSNSGTRGRSGPAPVGRLCPPVSIPQTSSAAVWTSQDAELIREDFYGCIDEELSTSNNIFLEQYRPKIPFEIKSKGGVYFVEESEERMELLTPEAIIPVQILSVDTEDVVHCRYFEDENYHKTTRGLNPLSLQKLLDEMVTYYENPVNQQSTNYKINDWTPLVGEVVVVAIKRYFFWPRVGQGRDYDLKDDFQRARILEVKSEGVTVKLLDDYGSGGILLENVFRIKPIFAKRPPQLFECEVAGLDFFQWKKLVHKAVQSSPIPRTEGDYSMNKVRLTFHGKYSKKGLPLVDLHLQQISSTKWLSLRSYVLYNLRFLLSPFNHLLEERSTCRILRADIEGNLYLQFKYDAELLTRMNSWMEKKRSLYDLRRSYLRLTPKILFPKREPERAYRNKETIYVASILDENAGTEMFFRVIILDVKRVSPTEKLIRVFCVDYAVERLIPVDALLPLNCFMVDLCFIPPLALKVHLHQIGYINTMDRHAISALFLQGEKEASLVCEWPSSAYPPDVTLYPARVEESDSDSFTSNSHSDSEEKPWMPKDKNEIDGLGKFLAENRLAVQYNAEQMKTMLERAELYSTLKQPKLEKERIKERAFGTGCSFLGENFQFSWPAAEDAVPVEDNNASKDSIPNAPEEETFLSQNYWHRRN